MPLAVDSKKYSSPLYVAVILYSPAGKSVFLRGITKIPFNPLTVEELISTTYSLPLTLIVMLPVAAPGMVIIATGESLSVTFMS